VTLRQAAVRAKVSRRLGPGLEEPWRSLHSAYHALRLRGRVVLGQFDLSVSEFAVLDLCARAPAKASQIAREVGVTPAGATDVIDRLEERRLVRRVADPTDRRAVLVSLAALGLRRHRETRAAVRSMLDEVDRAMTPAERRALALGMAALLRALPRKRA